MSLEDQEYLGMPITSNANPDWSVPGYCANCFMDGTMKLTIKPGLFICINCKVISNFTLTSRPANAFTGNPHKEFYPEVTWTPKEDARLKATRLAVQAGYYNEGGEERTSWSQHLFNTLYPFYMEVAQ